MITLFENFKNYNTNKNVAYSGVILDDKSRELLLTSFIYSSPIYSNWTKLAHHMTICIGSLPEHVKRYWIDENVTLTATEFGYTDKAVAVKVSGYFNIQKTEFDFKRLTHITLAINPLNGKPVDSNDITNWQTIENIKLQGTVKEIQY